MGNNQSLMDTCFNLRLQAREALKLHEKCVREEQQERMKVKAALEKNNVEAARIHASNSIRKHNEALRYLQYNAKLDMLRSQVESAARSQQVCGATTLHAARAQLTLELKKSLPEINKIIGDKNSDAVDIFQKFQKVFEDLEVREAYLDENVSASQVNLAPNADIDQLITQVAEEHALDVGDLMSSAGTILKVPLPQAKCHSSKFVDF